MKFSNCLIALRRAAVAPSHYVVSLVLALSSCAILHGQCLPVQTYKLLAKDGEADDIFGGRVAVHGATAIIGCFGNDDYGNNSGSAYLFDTITGEQMPSCCPMTVRRTTNSVAGSVSMQRRPSLRPDVTTTTATTRARLTCSTW